LRSSGWTLGGSTGILSCGGAPLGVISRLLNFLDSWRRRNEDVLILLLDGSLHFGSVVTSARVSSQPFIRIFKSFLSSPASSSLQYMLSSLSVSYSSEVSIRVCLCSAGMGLSWWMFMLRGLFLALDMPVPDTRLGPVLR
jgi:hypothetical protein